MLLGLEWEVREVDRVVLVLCWGRIIQVSSNSAALVTYFRRLHGSADAMVLSAEGRCWSSVSAAIAYCCAKTLAKHKQVSEAASTKLQCVGGGGHR